MRLRFGEDVEQVPHRFEGLPATEVEMRPVVIVDNINTAFLDKNGISSKAKWSVTGSAIDAGDRDVVLGRLPAPEILESEPPVLVVDPFPGCIPPCYALALKPHVPALLDLSITLTAGKEADMEAVTLRILEGGGLKETPQELAERFIEEGDAQSLQELLFGPPPPEPGAIEIADAEAPGAMDATSGSQLAEPRAVSHEPSALTAQSSHVSETALLALEASEGAPRVLVDVEWTHSRLGTPLLHLALTHATAAEEAKLAMARALLDAGAEAPPAGDVGSALDAPPTPLHLAVARGEGALVDLMLSLTGAFPAHALCLWEERRATTPLHLACARGDLAMARLLLAAGAHPDWSGRDGRSGSVTPLALAVRSGALDLVRLLVEEKRADLRLATNDPSFCALAEACRCPAPAPMVEYLLAQPRAVFQACYTACPKHPLEEVMVTAASHGWAAVIAALRRRNVEPRAVRHPDGRSLLIDAVEHAHVDAVAELLSAGVDPNDAGPASARTPLTAAACLADAAVARRLVYMLRAAGADPDAEDKAGRRAVEYARRLVGGLREGSELVVADLEAALPAPVLPKGWTTAEDEDLGKTYYFNVATKEVSWEMPVVQPWLMPARE